MPIAHILREQQQPNIANLASNVCTYFESCTEREGDREREYILTTRSYSFLFYLVCALIHIRTQCYEKPTPNKGYNKIRCSARYIPKYPPSIFVVAVAVRRVIIAHLSPRYEKEKVICKKIAHKFIIILMSNKCSYFPCCVFFFVSSLYLYARIYSMCI